MPPRAFEIALDVADRARLVGLGGKYRYKTIPVNDVDAITAVRSI